MIVRLLLLFLTFCTFGLSAQEYITNVQHYNLEKGLETRNIQSAFKDSQGFMWFCTDLGAYRFDGYEFKLFNNKNHTDATLFTSRIIEDEDKNLWLYHPLQKNNIGDLSILPFASDTLVPFEEHFKEQLPFPIEDIIYHSIYFPSSGFWIGNKKGEIYEYIGGKFKKSFVIPNHIFEKTITRPNLHIDKHKDQIWFLYNNHFFKVASNGEPEKEATLPDYLNFKIDNNGKFWFYGYPITLFKEHENAPIEKAPYEILEDPNIGMKIISDISPFFIIKRDNKLFDFAIFNYMDGEIIDFSKLGLEESKLSITNLFLENENTLWLCTYNGIYQIQFNKNLFFQYLNGNSTRGMIRGNDEKIWATSYSGLFELDPLKNNTSQLIDKSLNNGQSFLKDNQNQYWLGFGGRIYKFSNKDSILNNEYLIRNNNVPGGAAFFIFQHPINNSIIAGTQMGLFHYQEHLDSFIIYPKTNGFDAIHESNVRDFELINDSKNLLLATSEGIFQLDYDQGITHHFSQKNNTFPYGHITFIHTDQQDGTLWIGTRHGGLFHWDFPTGIPQQFTEKDGLVDNMIYSVHEDEKGFLWLPSNNGLMRFNKTTYEVNTFTTKDGIAHNEFNFQSNFQDEDRTLYLGGLNGITAFHPKNINLPDCNAQIHLTKIETPNLQTGEMISIYDDFNQKNGIHLTSNEQSINVSFAMLSYDNQDENKFAYKFEGLENTWQNIDGRSVRFNGLPYGKYSLWVKGQNAHGQWSSEILKIPIEIIQPFYKTWWFLILTTIISILVAAKLFANRRTTLLSKKNLELEKEVSRRTEELRKDKEIIEKQAEELQKLDTLKTQFFANVTHELRTPLALIIGPLKHLMNTTELDDKVLRSLVAIAQNGERLKDLVEEILDLSRYDLNKLQLNKQPVHFLSEIKKCVAGFDIKAQQKEIDFQLYYQLPLDIHLNIDARKIQKIVTNLLSNAFKFSEPRDQVVLNVLESKDKIHINVIDSGIGIPEEELSKIFDRFYQSKQNTTSQNGGLGIGLSLSKDLAHLMQGELMVSSNKTEGSTFTLKFPKEESSEQIVQQIVQQKEIESLLAEASQAVVTIPFDGNKNTILFIEDNPYMQNFVHDLLSPSVNILIADNGAKGWHILKEEKQEVDLIISDIMMPVMDGFTFLEKIKSDDVFQLIPVIMLTALTQEPNKIKAITFGVDDYLTKPFEPEELIARVNTLLENVNLRKNPVEIVTNPSEINKEEPILEPLESADLKWLKRLEALAFEKVTTPHFKIGQLAHEMAIGERQLSRKIKKITGLTAGNYLKEIRLQKARQLLENKAYNTVAEISYLVGFTTPQYFSKIFKERFGKLPSDYLK